MIFTDDDLKRLKECVDPQTNTLLVGLFRKLPLRITEEMTDPTLVSSVKVDLVALLARLDAAERVVKAHSKLEAEKINYDTFVDLLKDWRKAAGKQVSLDRKNYA